MNKRFYYILVIVAILIAICIWEQVSVDSFFSKVENKVYSIIDIVKDKEDINTKQIYENVEELETTWKGCEEILCFMVNLKDVEDIGIELTKMKTYIIENAVTDFKASLGLLLFYIDSYDNAIGISFENIF